MLSTYMRIYVVIFARDCMYVTIYVFTIVFIGMLEALQCIIMIAIVNCDICILIFT